MTLEDVENYAKSLNINHFRGVFMRDALPDKPHRNECGVINLAGVLTNGSHWTAFYKNDNYKIYFDSYGDAKPPKELVNYLGKTNLHYNTDQIQTYDDPPICGHLCLEVLRRLSDGEDWKSISSVIKSNKYVFTQWF